jgi:predicted DNA-binding protein
MNTTKRQSISLPSGVAQRVNRMAKNQRKSAARVMVELIEVGLDAKESEKQQFFALADRLSSATDPGERQRIKKQLARLTFGE